MCDALRICTLIIPQLLPGSIAVIIPLVTRLRSRCLPPGPIQLNRKDALLCHGFKAETLPHHRFMHDCPVMAGVHLIVT